MRGNRESRARGAPSYDYDPVAANLALFPSRRRPHCAAMPRSLFLLGLLTGLTLSLASLSTALFAASVREKRRIARARAAQGLGARRPRRRLAGADSDGYGEESGSESSGDEDEDEWQLIEVRKGEVVQGVQGAIGECVEWLGGGRFVRRRTTLALDTTRLEVGAVRRPHRMLALAVAL